MTSTSKLLLMVTALTLGAVLNSCASKTFDPLGKVTHYNPDHKGAWENPFRDDPNLAGVDVHQYGECVYDQSGYNGKHPCTIFYFFWNGRVRQIGYEPDGKVRDDFYWKNRLKPGDSWWAAVDFSYGSDPQFKTHRDPRAKVRKQGNEKPQ